MPFSKASKYKRFNVSEYMKNKRLAWLAVEQKSKKAQAMAKKLKRLDEKVGTNYKGQFAYCYLVIVVFQFSACVVKYSILIIQLSLSISHKHFNCQ